MLVFWIIVALLCLLTMWAIWRPLQNRSSLEMESIQQRNIAIANERAREIDSALEAGDIDEKGHDQARKDLETSLADELATSHELRDQFSHTSLLSNLGVLLLIPLLAVGVYSFNSNYNPEPESSLANGEQSTMSLEEAIASLENKVNANPQEPQGLYLLAQSYSRMGRYPEAAERFEQLMKLVPPDADLLVGYVDNQAMANGRIFTEEMAAKLEEALIIDPQNVSGLWLLGVASQQLGRPENALRHWLTVRPLLTSAPEASKELTLLIDQVSIELGETRANSIKAEFGDKSTTSVVDAIPAESIKVNVSIATELKSELSDSDTVFIYARAKSGPPMPLAASRQSVSALPLTVELNDSMAMMENMKLSNFEEVVVGARVSKSGQATPQSGDLESELVNVSKESSETVELVISKRRP